MLPIRLCDVIIWHWVFYHTFVFYFYFFSVHSAHAVQMLDARRTKVCPYVCTKCGVHNIESPSVWYVLAETWQSLYTSSPYVTPSRNSKDSHEWPPIPFHSCCPKNAPIGKLHVLLWILSLQMCLPRAKTTTHNPRLLWLLWYQFELFVFLNYQISHTILYHQKNSVYSIISKM